MKVYLAARYSRRTELLGYAAELDACGIEVTARWIQGLHEIPPKGVEANSAKHHQWCAMDDIEDIEAADVLVAFTEDADNVHWRNTGGRHVELGYAFGRGKHIIICGHHENVFCHLPVFGFAADWEGARLLLEHANRHGLVGIAT